MPTIIDAFELRATASPAERSATRVEEDRLQASPAGSAHVETVGAQGLFLFLLDAIVLWLVLAQLLYLVACPPGMNPEPVSLWACHALVAAGLVAVRVPPMIWD